MATSRLKTKYNDEIIPSLMETLKFKSVMQVPKILKISVNNILFSNNLDNFKKPVNLDLISSNCI